jgi:hypothetical protein
MYKDKINQKIDAFLAQKPASVYDNKELRFFWGNCYLRKKNYLLANKCYKESIVACLENQHQIWYASGLVSWVVDILILSGKLELIEKVEAEVSKFFQQPQHDTWPISFYAFSIIDLVQNKRRDFWIKKLLGDKKNLEPYILGTNLNAIINNDEKDFNIALLQLLKIHDKKVKYGALRESPEGFISMDGMSLVFLAQKRGIHVLIENEYIFPDYFNNLL